MYHIIDFSRFNLSIMGNALGIIGTLICWELLGISWAFEKSIIGKKISIIYPYFREKKLA